MINKGKHIFIKTAALFAGCFFLARCENDFKQVEDLGKKKVAQEEATRLLIYISEDSKIKAKLTSPYMVRTEVPDSPMIEFTKTLHVDFFDDSTKPESQLFAKYGRYYETKGKVLLRDSVVVFNIKGDTLKTNELWWNRDMQLFYTNEKVQVRGRDMQQDGTGLIANQDFKKWTIYNSTGPINVADSTLPK